MAATLDQVLAEVKKNSKQIADVKKDIRGLKGSVNSLQQDMGKVQKSVAGLQKDMSKVLKCVATENADFEVKIKSGGNSGKTVIPMAAKPH